MANNSFMTNRRGVLGWRVSEASCCVSRSLVGSGIVSFRRNFARSTGSRLSVTGLRCGAKNPTNLSRQRL